jgi:replicative DNA helicase
MYGLTIDGDSDSEIIVAKQRNGPTGRVKVTFVSEYAKFESMSSRAF